MIRLDIFLRIEIQRRWPHRDRIGCGGDKQIRFNCNNAGAEWCQILKCKMKHLIAATIGEQFIGIIGLQFEALLAGRLFDRCKGPQLGLLNDLMGLVLERKTVLNSPGDRIPAGFCLWGSAIIRLHRSYRGRSKAK